MVKKLLLKPVKLLASLADLGLLALRRAAAAGPASAPPGRILVLGYGGIGDILFFMPAMRALREAYPRARIAYVSNKNAATEELIPASGLADEVWTVDAEKWFWLRPRELTARLKAGNFDLVLASQAAPFRLFAPSLLSIPIRVGHCRPLEAPHAGWSALRYALWRLRRGLISQEFERRLVLNRKVWVRGFEEHTVRRNLRLIEALGLSLGENASRAPELPEPEASRRYAEKKLPSAPGLKTVGLHIGSPQSQYDKIWPAEKWGEVCGRIAAARPVRLALFGGPDEAFLAPLFEKAFGGDFVNLVGSAGLLDAFAAIRRCELFLTNDTGLAKAAMALGVPTLTVWGPSDRSGYGVFWNPERHAEVYRVMPCSPCVRMGLRQEGSGVINFSNCGHHDCLRRLELEAVAGAALKKLP